MKNFGELLSDVVHQVIETRSAICCGDVEMPLVLHNLQEGSKSIKMMPIAAAAYSRLHSAVRTTASGASDRTGRPP